MAQLIHEEETYAIIGAAMEVYNHLGNGFLEAVYQEALCIEFALRGVPFQAQRPLVIRYKDRPLTQKYIPDFVVYDAVIVEIKAVDMFGPNEEAQLLNYLKATGLHVGLLINFGGRRKLQWKRMVL
ncbi:MAG: GxxExxY protein [Anaerolineae bacterium]